MTREGLNPTEDGLTPEERALFLDSAAPRGYAPAEALPEPELPPAGPAGMSASPPADAIAAMDADPDQGGQN